MLLQIWKKGGYLENLINDYADFRNHLLIFLMRSFVNLHYFIKMSFILNKINETF